MRPKRAIFSLIENAVVPRVALQQLDNNSPHLGNVVSNQEREGGSSHLLLVPTPMDVSRVVEPPINQSLSMNIFCWNCRGTASRRFVRLLKDIKRDYSCSMMILVETHSSGTTAKRIAKRCGFSNSFIVDVGGLWCLWDSPNWNVQVLKY